MLQRKRAAQPPEDSVGRVGPVAFDNRLGVARNDEQFRRRSHRNEFFDKGSGLVEKVVGRSDVEQGTGGGRRERHVVDFGERGAQRGPLAAVRQSPTKLGA